MTDQEITLRVHCRNLPGREFGGRRAVRLGLQKGAEVVADVPADAVQVTFSVPLRVGENTRTGKPNFLGPFAHGTPTERFIYLSWGERKGGGWEMFRRAKLQLRHLDWETIERALATSRSVEAFLDMTDAKGGPLCSSVGGGNVRWGGAAAER